MSLQDFCRKRVVTISPDASVMEGCRMMKDNNVGCIVAEDDGKLCGILTDRDIALKVAGEKRDPQMTSVRDVMTRNPVRISVEKDLRDLTALMHSHHVRRVPIVNGIDKTLGIVTLDDLIALLGDEMSEIGKAVSEGFPQGNA
ncbi:MAG: CBS domain-containing protein [Deltaproteobacteria bacterium]|nr:CBS domain-containing protein [Deltaproteobacteria bacterium]